MRRAYPLLNAFFHLLHIALITFVLTGWLFPATRVAHLVLVLLTLGSWFVLGIWFGAGYCPITEWHWKIKDAWGEGRPGRTYIDNLLRSLLPPRIAIRGIDKGVVAITFLVAAISLALNLHDWLS